MLCNIGKVWLQGACDDLGALGKTGGVVKVVECAIVVFLYGSTGWPNHATKFEENSCSDEEQNTHSDDKDYEKYFVDEMVDSSVFFAIPFTTILYLFTTKNNSA